MKDYSELKLLAEAAKTRSDEYEWYSSDGGYGLDPVDLKFIAAAKPAAVLALIAELEGYQRGAKAEADAGDEARAEVSELRAEIEALRKQIRDQGRHGEPSAAAESLYEKGRRLFREGYGVSCLWGECKSDDELPHIHRGWEEEANSRTPMQQEAK